MMKLGNVKKGASKKKVFGKSTKKSSRREETDEDEESDDEDEEEGDEEEEADEDDESEEEDDEDERPAKSSKMKRRDIRKGSLNDAPDDFFEGVEDAKVTGSYVYEKPGKYIERIDRVVVKKNRKKAWVLIFEKTVVHVLDDDNGQGHSVGDRVSHLMKRDSEYFLSEIKKIVANILMVKPKRVTGAICKQISSKEQPLRGMLIECDNKNKVVGANEDGKGYDWTVVNYKRVPAVKAKKMIDKSAIKELFPNGALDKLIELESDGQEEEQEEVEERPRAPKGSRKAQDDDDEEEGEEVDDDAEDDDEEEEAPRSSKKKFSSKKPSRRRDADD